MNVKHLLQNKTYGFKKIEQEAKKKKNQQKILKRDTSFKEHLEEENVLEQEVADTMIENLKIDFPHEDSYKTYYMAETGKKIENGKTKKERVFRNCNAIL